MKQQLERIFMPKSMKNTILPTGTRKPKPVKPRKLKGMKIKAKKPKSGRGKKPEKQMIDLFSKGAK